MPVAPPAPLIGREEECERLAGILARDGVALVIGEPGIGKTTLALAAVRAAGRRLVHGGGFATLSGIPYLPLQVALGRPVSGDEVAVARQVEAAVRDAVLLVDDLQWTDAASRIVLGLLAGRVALVVTSRADGLEQDLLDAPGVETIRLGPLRDPEAAVVVRRANPDLGESDVRRVIARAGGNPLVLEEIARDGDVSTTIARAIAAQLELASPAARRSLRVLAVADRPMPAEAFEADLGELERLGMVTIEHGRIAIRHGVIAEALIAGMSADDRAAAHASVAALADDPADRALHLAQAGRAADAVAVAQRALTETWDMRRRLVLLRLVADLASGPDALSHRLAAARLAVEVEQPSVVVELLDRSADGEPGLVAIRDGLLARAFEALGQRAAASDALDRCRRGAANDPTGEAAHLLAVEDALARTHVGDIAAGLAILDQADIDGAGHDPTYRHRRAGLRSTLRFLQGEAPDVDGMRAALDDALRDRMPGPAASIGLNLHSMILASDGPAAALAFSREVAQRCRTAGIEGWRLQTEAVQDLTFCGRPSEAVVVADELLEQPLPVDTLTWAQILRAEALTHLGRFAEASASLVAIEHLLTDEWGSRGEALTAKAGIAYWSGDLRGAVAAADQALTIPTFYAANHMLTALTRAWAMIDLDQPLRDLPAADRGWLADGAAIEWSALLARRRGQPSRELFQEAAAHWDGLLVFRAALCRWAAADAARMAGAPDAASLLLDMLEDMEQKGFEPIARRVRRSLRLSGVRAPRALPPLPGKALLTPREREILDLVGKGLANIEIARQMGLGRPTVARILSNAMGKLGADTRAQAIVLAHSTSG